MLSVIDLGAHPGRGDDFLRSHHRLQYTKRVDAPGSDCGELVVDIGRRSAFAYIVRLTFYQYSAMEVLEIFKRLIGFHLYCEPRTVN